MILHICLLFSLEFANMKPEWFELCLAVWDNKRRNVNPFVFIPYKSVVCQKKKKIIIIQDKPPYLWWEYRNYENVPLQTSPFLRAQMRPKKELRIRKDSTWYKYLLRIKFQWIPALIKRHSHWERSNTEINVMHDVDEYAEKDCFWIIRFMKGI